jgi:lysophospholipase
MLFLMILALGACGDSNERREAFTDVRLPPGLPHRFWAPPGWAWGLLQVGDQPAMRYGVAAPNGASIGHIVILPGYAETAESWFETAGALIDRDYTVWILEAVGQGGSGRRADFGLRPSPGFETDIEGLIAFDRLIVRPRPDETVTLLASRQSDLVSLAAVERGYRPTRLVLSDPLGPTPSGGPWRRTDSRTDLSPRRQASDRWSLANPDLRTGGPSRNWISAREKLQAAVLSPALDKVIVPVVVISPHPGRFPCERLPVCRRTIIPSNESYPFAEDAERDRWLAAVSDAGR